MFNLPLQNSVLKSRTSAVHRFKWDFVFVVVISVHSMYMLSTPLVVSHYFSAKVSPEWRLNLGFGTQKKCPFPLNRSVPSLEVTDAKIMWQFLGPKFVSPEWRCPLYGGLPKEWFHCIFINYCPAHLWACILSCLFTLIYCVFYIIEMWGSLAEQLEHGTCSAEALGSSPSLAASWVYCSW